jgi:hypothetical protein
MMSGQFNTYAISKFLAKRSLIVTTVTIALGSLYGSVSQPAQAAQAPWYWWQSTLSGKQICRQTSPGEGWQQLAKPYLDARCQRPKN